jgi:hypothetical protein
MDQTTCQYRRWQSEPPPSLGASWAETLLESGGIRRPGVRLGCAWRSQTRPVRDRQGSTSSSGSGQTGCCSPEQCHIMPAMIIELDSPACSRLLPGSRGWLERSQEVIDICKTLLILPWWIWTFHDRQERDSRQAQVIEHYQKGWMTAGLTSRTCFSWCCWQGGGAAK